MKNIFSKKKRSNLKQNLWNNLREMQKKKKMTLAKLPETYRKDQMIIEEMRK